MTRYATEELLEASKEMTLVELTEFKKTFEEEFGVTAAAPVAIAAAGATGDGTAAEEKDEFNVILEDAGAEKTGAIKTVRETISGLGLKEVGEMVKSVPKAIPEGVSRDDVEAAKAKLEEAGAKVSLK